MRELSLTFVADQHQVAKRELHPGLQEKGPGSGDSPPHRLLGRPHLQHRCPRAVRQQFAILQHPKPA